MRRLREALIVVMGAWLMVVAAANGDVGPSLAGACCGALGLLALTLPEPHR